MVVSAARTCCDQSVHACAKPIVLQRSRLSARLDLLGVACYRHFDVLTSTKHNHESQAAPTPNDPTLRATRRSSLDGNGSESRANTSPRMSSPDMGAESSIWVISILTVTRNDSDSDRAICTLLTILSGVEMPVSPKHCPTPQNRQIAMRHSFLAFVS